MKDNESKTSLHRGLKSRHMQMIALGASVGTGLFYGSAPTIQLVGPGVIFSYLLTGIFIFFLMRMLGEMSVREPVSGSFTYFASKYWSSFAGYLSGWNYWIVYMLASMAELAAISVYLDFWLPGIPHWITTLACITLVTVINLINVRAYGEVEFFASLIKVVAIIAMIAFGAYLIFFGDMGSFPHNFSNLWIHGGLFPNGAYGFIASIAVVMFSFGGVELIGITAGEAEHPEKTLPKAINELLARILIFYVGTMTVIMALSPWNELGTQASPFVQIFTNIGIPAAAHILNFVVVVAALSVYNSLLYSNSRILHSMALSGDAPKIFKNLTATGVPLIATLFCAALALIVVFLTYIFPSASDVFLQLLAIIVAGLIIAWFIIPMTHLKFRKRFAREGRLDELKFKSILYPFTNYFCFAFIAMAVGVMLTMDSMRTSIYIIPVWIGALYIAYRLKKK